MGKVKTGSRTPAARVVQKLHVKPETIKHVGPGITPVEVALLVQRRCKILRCEHSAVSGDISLVLYDVTTRCVEAGTEDELRNVADFKKERREDPYLVVVLLVNRKGLSMGIDCLEGNHVESRTIVPIIKQFQTCRDFADKIVADAGVLSSKNLDDLADVRLWFIVGSRSKRRDPDKLRPLQGATLSPIGR